MSLPNNYTDKFAVGRSDPGVQGEAVDLSTTDYVGFARYLYIGTAGDIKVDLVNGGTVTFAAHPAGYFRQSVSKIYKIGTLASNIIALV